MTRTLPARHNRLIFLALLVGLLGVVQPVVTAENAQAAPVTGFDPGDIISDSLMYDSATMNAATIQSFLSSKGSSCVPTSGNTCIKDYRETTPTRPADALCPLTYQGAAGESAATIIAKASVACGINPQVLLVTLQKEQGLITASSGKPARTYSRALGFGCPDNAGGWCDPQYAGFANQVYAAAKQLKRYAANPTGYSYRAGRVNTILWHPNTACGSSQVYIANQATASLYNYTPYRPNQAALNAGYGSGDSCSSYGNRNFYLYFTDWFGSTHQREPVGSVDVVRAVDSSTIMVAGWALDPDVTGSVDVHVYIDGRAAAATTARNARPDVAAAYGRTGNYGYDLRLSAGSGVHQVCVYAIDGNGGTNKLLGCRSVTLANQNPVGRIDVVQATGPGTVQVAGWAFDPDTTAPIDVHVYVDGRAALATTARGDRPDVAQAYGRNGAVGYDSRINVSAGSHQVCVYAIDSGGGTNVLLGCRTVTAANKQPVGVIDVVRGSGPGQAQVRGWAFDPDSTASIDLHVYTDGAFSTIIKANTSRSDVAAVHGVGTNHGYDALIPMVAGSHSVCVYAIDTSGGTNVLLGCRTATVDNTTVQGALETATPTTAASGGTASAITVSGWAWDFDDASPVTVRVLVDGVVGATRQANEAHAAVVPATRTTIGWSATIPAVPGAHRVCVEALDKPGGAYVTIGCQDSVVVANASPVGVIELARGVSATAGQPSGVRLDGWAQDWDTPEPIWVHVYVDGVKAGEVLANAPRPDVESVHRNGAAHGFSITVPAGPGSRQVCAYSINVPRGTNHMIGASCLSVTVG
ncbi:MAG: hypothetical protein ACTMIR_01230 [Cellulomonadaceae bacterium]